MTRARVLGTTHPAPWLCGQLLVQAAGASWRWVVERVFCWWGSRPACWCCLDLLRGCRSSQLAREPRLSHCATLGVACRPQASSEDDMRGWSWHGRAGRGKRESNSGQEEKREKAFPDHDLERERGIHPSHQLTAGSQPHSCNPPAPSIPVPAAAGEG